MLLGARAPVHCTAPGKAILSRCSHGELQALPETFERYTAKTITTREALIAELAIARERLRHQYLRMARGREFAGRADHRTGRRSARRDLGHRPRYPGDAEKLDGYAPVLVEAARELSRRIGG